MHDEPALRRVLDRELALLVGRGLWQLPALPCIEPSAEVAASTAAATSSARRCVRCRARLRAVRACGRGRRRLWLFRALQFDAHLGERLAVVVLHDACDRETADQRDLQLRRRRAEAQFDFFAAERRVHVGLDAHCVDALLQAGLCERTVRVSLGPRVASTAPAAALRVVATECHRPAVAAHLLAHRLHARAQLVARRFVEVALAHLHHQRTHVLLGLAVDRQRAHELRRDRKALDGLRRLCVGDDAADHEAVFERDVERLRLLGIELRERCREVALLLRRQVEQRVGQMLEEEPAVLVCARRLLVAAAAELATATAAAAAAVVLRARTRGHFGIGDRLAEAVHDDAREFEARAEHEVGHFGAKVLCCIDGLAGAVLVALRARGDAPIARCDVGEAVVAVRVRLLRGQRLVAIALRTHPVVAVGLQAHFGERDAVAGHVGHAAGQLPAVVDREFAEVQLAADFAEVAIELRRRVLLVHDEQIDAQRAERLALEREPPVGVGAHRLRHAPILPATALPAAAEVEPHLGVSHWRAEAIDHASAQQQLGAFLGAEFVADRDLLARVSPERFRDRGVGRVRLCLDRDLVAGVPVHDRRLARAEEAWGHERDAGHDERGQQGEEKGSVGHQGWVLEEHSITEHPCVSP